MSDNMHLSIFTLRRTGCGPGSAWSIEGGGVGETDSDSHCWPPVSPMVRGFMDTVYVNLSLSSRPAGFRTVPRSLHNDHLEIGAMLLNKPERRTKQRSS